MSFIKLSPEYVETLNRINWNHDEGFRIYLDLIENSKEPVMSFNFDGMKQLHTAFLLEQIAQLQKAIEILKPLLLEVDATILKPTPVV